MDSENMPSMMPLALANQIQALPQFVNEPDEKYVCAYCGDVLRPPVRMTMCGHRLCDACVPILFEETDEATCPGDEDCETLKRDEIHPDIATSKELLRMPVYCSFKDNGCPATPKWSALAEHEKQCDYAAVQCHNPGCDAIVLRSQLESHEKECAHLPVLCPICDEYVPQKDLRNGHEKNCRPKPKKCPYSELGCTFEGTPNELKQHTIECTEKHNLQLVKTTTKVNQETENLKQTINELLSQLTDLKTQIDSPQFNSNNKYIQGFQKSLAKFGEDIIKLNQTLDNKVDKKELIEYNSKLSDIQTIASMHESRLGYLEQGSGGGEQTLQKIRQMESSIGAYDVRLAEYDIRFRLLETAAYDGQMIWKITNYRRRKKDAEDGRTLSLYSQPFYTSYYGYKLCARAYLNGDGMGRGTHLSLFFVVMRGEYDALLPWPFRPKVTLALLDQSGSRRHIKDTFRPDPTSTSFRRPVSEMNIASGSPMFAAHSTVESDSYLRDDTLFVRVTIDQSDMPEILP